MPIPTGVRTHTAARAGPGSPLSNTLEKQNRQPVELCLQPAPRTGNTVGARVGKGRQRAAPARPPTPGGTRAQQAGRQHLLRGPRAGAAPQPGPRGALAALRSSARLRRVRRNHRLPSRPASLPRPPRSDVRRLGAGYLWPGDSEFSLGRVLIAVPWDL